MSSSPSLSPNSYHYLPYETQKELLIIVQALMTPGKGILNADESPTAMAKKFREIHLENTEENRREYRKVLFTTENIENYLSGVTLFHETVFQKADDGETYLCEVLRDKRIIPGIKLDRGVVPLFGTEDECTTQGLDDIGPRCEQYKKMGCHFAKWRCIFKIGNNTPSQLAIRDNTQSLARFASVCQAYRLVPMLEPEVLSDGSHDILRCQAVTEQVLVAVFKELNDYKVFLEAVILKLNMVTPGHSYKIRTSAEEIAEATLVTLYRAVPPLIPGVTFLSGGQSEEDATVNLNAINVNGSKAPWNMTFSFGRALHTSALFSWKGNSQNVLQAQEEFIKRAKANAEASLGEYTASSRGRSHAKLSLFIPDNVY